MKNTFIILCLAISTMNAQTWKNYTVGSTSNQLPAYNVQSVLVENDSSLWLGTTEGVSHYNGKTWKTYLKKDGLLQNFISSISKDRQGNIWAGTNGGGAARFEGLKWISVSKAEGLPDTVVNAVESDTSSRIWFGTNKGLARLDGKTWTYFNTTNGLSNNRVKCIAIDKQGKVWVGTEGGLSVYNDTIWKTITTANGLPGNIVNSIAIDSLGNKWLAIAKDVVKYSGSTFVRHTGNSIVLSVVAKPKGYIWASTTTGLFFYNGSSWRTASTSYGDGTPSLNGYDIDVDSRNKAYVGTQEGLWVYESPRFTQIIYPANGLAHNNVNAVAIDPFGNKWFGTEAYGITKFDGTNWITYTKKNGLPTNNINSISIDNQGIPWAGTGTSLAKFTGQQWKTYQQKDVSEVINDVLSDKSGNQWIAKQAGLARFNEVNWVDYKPALGTGAVTGWTLMQDLEGNIWLGATDGIRKFDGKNWTKYSTVNGIIIGSVTAAAVDAKGNKWFGTLNYGAFRFDGVTWTNYNNTTGLSDNYVKAIATDSAGGIWVGTNEGGVCWWNGTKWVIFGMKDGLASKNVSDIAIDNEGNKWFATGAGVSCYSDNGAGPVRNTQVQIGLVFQDLNGNGKRESGELLAPAQVLKLDNDFITTQDNGLFYAALTSGTHKFSYYPSSRWKLTTDSSFTVSISQKAPKDTLFFGIQATVQVHQAEVVLTGADRLRTYMPAKYWVNTTNTGTFNEEGSVVLNLNPAIQITHVLPAPDIQTTGKLEWKFKNWLPNEKKQYSIETQSPGVTYMGERMVTTAHVYLNSTSAQSSDTITQVLLGSFDPNDKMVDKGVGTQGYVLHNTPLEYTIRFQNTGTDTAFTVNIIDTLDSDLNPATLELIASSHSAKLLFFGNHSFVFRFDNILLPDSHVNQAGSNGFVKYRIQPRKNLAENTQVKNRAGIYFDFNPPVITNTTLNTFVEKIPVVITTVKPLEELQEKIVLYPNPSQTKVQLNRIIRQARLVDILGQVVWFSESTKEIPVEGLKKGLYILQSPSMPKHISIIVE